MTVSDRKSTSTAPPYATTDPVGPRPEIRLLGSPVAEVFGGPLRRRTGGQDPLLARAGRGGAGLRRGRRRVLVGASGPPAVGGHQVVLDGHGVGGRPRGRGRRGPGSGRAVGPDDGVLGEEGTARPGSSGDQVGRGSRWTGRPISSSASPSSRSRWRRRSRVDPGGDRRGSVPAGDLGGRRGWGARRNGVPVPGGVRAAPRWRPRWSPPASGTRPPGERGRGRWRRTSCPGSVTSAASGRPPWICAGRQEAATTPTTSGGSTRGTWPPARSSAPRPADGSRPYRVG